MADCWSGTLIGDWLPGLLDFRLDFDLVELQIYTQTLGKITSTSQLHVHQTKLKPNLINYSQPPNNVLYNNTPRYKCKCRPEEAMNNLGAYSLVPWVHLYPGNNFFFYWLDWWSLRHSLVSLHGVWGVNRMNNICLPTFLVICFAHGMYMDLVFTTRFDVLSVSLLPGRRSWHWVLCTV